MLMLLSHQDKPMALLALHVELLLVKKVKCTSTVSDLLMECIVLNILKRVELKSVQKVDFFFFSVIVFGRLPNYLNFLNV